MSVPRRVRCAVQRSFLLALVSWMAGSRGAAAQEATDWPDLARPAAAIGGGEGDTGVVVGVQDYAFVPDVPGAERNADAWYDYLTRTRKTPPQAVKLLRGEDATREEILAAAQQAATKVGPKGTVWFVFVGHGAPAADGKDGLLVGVDAQQKALSLEARSVRRGALLDALGKSRARKIVVLIDACFSGRDQDGRSLAPSLQPLLTIQDKGSADPRLVMLTAAKSNQFAGALPGAERPAFSYLALGALRGWAAATDGQVTAEGVWRYALDALDATLRGRNQTPELTGRADTVLTGANAEQGPNLAVLAKTKTRAPEAASAAGPAAPQQNVGLMFHFANQQQLADPQTLPVPELQGLDVASLGKLDDALRFERGAATASAKAAQWRTLAQLPRLSAIAEARAQQWDRYAFSLSTHDRRAMRDADWEKLSQLLAYEVVPQAEKQRLCEWFVLAYQRDPGISPSAAGGLAKFLTAGLSQRALAWLAQPTGSASTGTNWMQVLRTVNQQLEKYESATRSASGRPLREAIEREEQACETGRWQACWARGARLWLGRGILANEPKAATMFQRACGMGWSPGCFALGIMYENGVSVEADKVKAAELFRKSCGRNDAHSCYELAAMQPGHDAVPSTARATTLLSRACSLGFSEACPAPKVN